MRKVWCAIWMGLSVLLVFQQGHAQMSAVQHRTADPAVLSPPLQGAVAALEAGDPTSAIVDLRDILRTNENDLQALRLLATAHLRQEDYTQALDVCRKLAALDSTDAGIQATLGYLQAHLGDLTGAEGAYKRALDLNPNLIQAYQGVGWIYLREGHLDSALDMVSRTTERAPNYAPNYILMGRVLTAQGFFEDAAIAYNKAFALQANLRERYGILLQELGLRHHLTNR